MHDDDQEKVTVSQAVEKLSYTSFFTLNFKVTMPVSRLGDYPFVNLFIQSWTSPRW